MVKLLLTNYKVNPNSRNDYSQTPLRWALENEDKEVVETLLNTNRVNVNSRGRDRQIPL
jgi:ankyrin repeat protein